MFHIVAFYDLPEHWLVAPLSELVDSINSGFPSGQHNSVGQGVPHLRPMNISPNGEIDLSEIKYVEPGDHDTLRKDDVLFNNTNSPVWVGKSAYIKADTKWAYSNHMTRIRLFTNSLDPGWISYALHHLFQIGYFQQNCRNHVNQASINTSFLMNEVSLPIPPLAEQQRIVAAIETHFTRLDTAIAGLRRLQANLKRYRAAVLKAACEGRLVPQDPSDEPANQLLDRILAERRAKWQATNPGKKYQEPTPPDTSGLPELPEGWVWASLDSIAQVRTGVAKGRKLDGQNVISLPYLRVANVQDGYLDLSEIKTIEIPVNEIERYRLKPNDILFNEGGDRDKLGRGAIWPGNIEDCIHQNHVFSVRLYTSAIYPKWVNFARQLTYARDHFWERASQTTNLASINSTNLRSLPIPISPLAEQTRIIAEVERRLSIIDQHEKAVRANLARAARLRQSILKRAFSGRLVPQDPADEPASVLLERIKATRTSKPKSKQMKLEVV